jgi:hypothetical protein
VDLEACGFHVNARLFVYKSFGGRRMIVVTVELHDADDVIDLIEMLQTFNERLIA